MCEIKFREVNHDHIRPDIEVTYDDGKVEYMVKTKTSWFVDKLADGYIWILKKLKIME